MNHKPLETILTIAKQNSMLRWLVIILAMCIMGMTALFIKKPPQLVWVITPSGQIMAGPKQVYSWEPLEMLRRAFEVMFVPSDNREALLPQFFMGGPLDSALAYKPDIRFTNFRIEKQDISPNGSIIVIGTVLRESKKDIHLSIELTKADRTEANPFGLKISSTSIIN